MWAEVCVRYCSSPKVVIGPGSALFICQAEDGIRSGCLFRGLGDVYKGQDVHFGPDVPQHIQDRLVDPITSVGLLISLLEEKAHVLVEKLKGVTICNAIVGRVTAKQDRAIVVL